MLRLQRIQAQTERLLSVVSGAFGGLFFLFLERLRGVLSTSRTALSVYVVDTRLPTRRQRAVAAGLVVVLHVVVVWVFATSLRHVRLGDQLSESRAMLLSPTPFGADTKPSVAAPTMTVPQSIALAVPVITIAEDTRPAASMVTALDMSHVLPPRPDPAHRNAPPRLPAHLAKFGGTISAVLRILVVADGSIAEAQIARTSGNAALDALALSYVKANWRFVAATASGRSVPDWTTVLVPFQSA